MPQDRRTALAQGEEIAARRWGVVLFADITGFTPLTDRLVAQYGRRAGADTLVRLLNQVYPPLIAMVEKWGGSVIGFSGDALTCWFAAVGDNGSRAPEAGRQQTARRSVMAAAEMQTAMGEIVRGIMSDLDVARLAIRITITSGDVARILVGDPALYVLDALAGAPLDRIAQGDHLAKRNEIILDEPTWHALQPDADETAVVPWQVDDSGRRFAVWNGQSQWNLAALSPGAGAFPALSEELTSSWILPPLRAAVNEGAEEFLAELRPAVALFVRFGGIDFSLPRAPEQLQMYIRWAQEVVDRYDGALIQVTTGDKGAYFYAVFGAPVAHDDDVERALLAAADLLDPPEACSFISSTQVGIGHGLLRVGTYGGPTRRTYGAQGDPVNTAARLMSAAENREILTTATVAEVVRERGRTPNLPLAVESAGPRVLKGRQDATECFRVTRVDVHSAPGQRQHFGATLFGRMHELRAIAARLASVGGSDSHAGALIILEGPAGIGKSHLLHEAVLAAQSAGWEILRAASHSTTQNTPFAAARQFVSALLRLERTPDDATASLVGVLQQILTNADDRAPLLNDLLGIALPENDFTRALDARTRQDALIALLIELIQVRARAARLLFVLEDSHWLDENSVGILSALLAMLEHAPVAAITTVRPNALPAAIRAQDSLTLRLQIGDLGSESMTELVRARLGGAVSPLAASLILMQSQGNPFFAEEFTDALVEAGRLVQMATDANHADAGMTWQLSPATVRTLRSANCLEGEDDEATVRKDALLTEANLGVPNSIYGILLARLDRLPDTARLVLKVASVAGRSFSLALLRRVRLLESHRDELAEWVRLAQGRDFIRIEESAAGASHTVSAAHTMSAAHLEEQDVDAERYYFRHALIRDVAYNTLLDEQQRDLHEQVAYALEATQPAATEELAHHYYRSDITRPDLRRRAHTYLAAAARHAQSDYANETAIAFYKRALELEEDVELLCRAAEVLHILGRREEEVTTLQRLLNADTAPAWERALLWAEYHEALGDYAQAQDALQRALDIARREGNRRRLARVYIKLGTIAWRQGEFDEAQSMLDQALRNAEAADAASERADALYALGLVNRQQARYEEAQQCFAEDLAIRATAPNPEREARALNAMGNMRAVLHDPAGALVFFERALAIRRTIGDRAGVGGSLLAIGQCYSSMARLAEAEEMLHEALRIQRSIRNRFQECLVGNELGIVQWLCGQYAAAEKTLTESLAIARALESAMLEAYVLCNLGQVQRDAALAVEQEDGERFHSGTQAIATLESGLEMALEQEDLQLAAIYQSDLALALHVVGDDIRALEVSRRAEQSFREIDQEKELTTVLPTRARILLALGDAQEAADIARRTLAMLETSVDDPHEFAHRDYFYCGWVLEACGDWSAADRAFVVARALLLARADKITRPDLRRSFLENVPDSRAILATARK